MFKIDPTQYLGDWMVRFLKNRDAFFKKIKDIKQDKDKIIVKEKDREVIYTIVPFISDIDAVLKSLEKNHVGLVVYNTIDNFQKVKDAWNKLIKLDYCMIYFVNPFSKTEKKWVVNPKTHTFVSDKSALKVGLNSMFEMVETTTEQEILKIIKD